MDTSRISKRFLLGLLPVVLAAGIVLGAVSHGFGLDTAVPGNGSAPVRVSRLSTYHIPHSLSFCGEKMPLQTANVRERMEQAFYTELSDAQIILDLKRSHKYFPYIEKELRRMNLPEDLKYLPVVESALRNLVSYRQAAGIWQFTRTTARKYGLVVNYYVDERFNFRKSTAAALRYLEDLHSEFGSWAMAAAAYNMGENGLERIVRFQMNHDYYDLHLNDETKRFVFRIVAVKQIMSHYRKYGFDFVETNFYPPPDVRTVEVGGVRDLAAWAISQGTTYGQLKYLNPWILRRMLPYGKWTVDLPADSHPVTLAEQGSTSNSSGDSASTVYVVKEGDSLTRIAHHYGVTVGELAGLNDLGNRGYLRAGQRLIVPSSFAGAER